MPSPGRPAARTYRIADTLSLHVQGPAALLRPFDRFYGPMIIDLPDTPPGPTLSLTLTPMQPIHARHTFEQRYRGGRWRIGFDAVDGDTLDATAAVDRLGRVMIAQAGVASLLRWMLGQRGFAWLHAAMLTRDDEALILAGPSGIGKSQLVLRAIRDGWRYITDDHTLVSERGLTGLTTPILVRGYGGWPTNLPQPTALRLKRFAARLTRAASFKRINLMLGHTPPAGRRAASPAPRRCPTTLCLLEPGDAVTTRGVPADAVADRLFDGSRDAGRFLDNLAEGYQGDRAACPIDTQAFWREQRVIINKALAGCACFTATLPRKLDDAAATSLFALLGLAGDGKGGGDG